MPMVEIFFGVTLFGEVVTVGFFAFLISIFLWRKCLKQEIIAIWMVLIGSALTTYLIKIIIDRPRPIDAFVFEDTASFPSGHATVAGAFYGFLTYLLWRNFKNTKYRELVIIAGAILVFLIGFSRLYLGVHYLTDVLAGYLVGLLWFFVGIKIDRITRK
ncbi:MAG: hypothetical protein A2921_03745 [Candidatus Magasanikbacteria bacterium RIFCSPLOWO2_01_FULL_43_20b]|uniref:Phosphatidic acid phosphatase type 2/haloperoxidase domain-containing protein n=1 Tax=Candidatus Magasanikbacteria bacterium RIFCSPLOWO2_12_FULL_43_12 TaxID=1798692 RepID=A0A1F6MRF3_9BACT|nr:MAG: hypothetical protein A3C74_00050 [Candidatus Magasanikbacteria bacterium RIFCSPHIGHO2_02_FULL_44_13]OGH72515.1 MAG: hypothetical protein A3I93_04335 [Candidatus Magasanikbacteria bacterium RIFCSPLOWO2_02_FULL_43_22]OGH73686.1 MAG: hypothetical protein A2921_03745 [Candidatus Magasanikbacteria bacterium RIFCSPLOWO2_01_FULL_43_20b]OGH74100.1 MAG: hypothetical protein A3G00_05005 [Candidatus Magasanikbacteria bacterium RIFCSPLOWO2_12_FULL_43_12]